MVLIMKKLPITNIPIMKTTTAKIIIMMMMMMMMIIIIIIIITTNNNNKDNWRIPNFFIRSGSLLFPTVFSSDFH